LFALPFAALLPRVDGSELAGLSSRLQAGRYSRKRYDELDRPRRVAFAKPGAGHASIVTHNSAADPASPERETSSLLLFDGASRDAADEAIEEKIVRDRHWDARDQRRAHQFTPVEDVAANEVGRDPQGDGLFLR
jgi:hypothetical protein